GEIQLNKSIINIHTIIKNIAETFEISIQDRKGKLHFELNAKHVEIEADPLHITNVFATLLDNANKYSPEEPEISINTLSDKEKVIISIQDNGKGIKAEDLKHVFEKFYRVPTGNIHDVKGFGLGLFYVKSILKSHNGHITASSEPNIGSTFTITLPLIK
ncbi:HAMP domain-containing histidine kinase, partial [Flavobacteriales bacterium]|nr:HAMP domain-containing histidine kinase [Flavobacteriales bacterium]